MQVVLAQAFYCAIARVGASGGWSGISLFGKSYSFAMVPLSQGWFNLSYSIEDLGLSDFLHDTTGLQGECSCKENSSFTFYHLSLEDVQHYMFLTTKELQLCPHSSREVLGPTSSLKECQMTLHNSTRARETLASCLQKIQSETFIYYIYVYTTATYEHVRM